ncbi:hypothetical protein LCGC14_1713760 [marine sediment metagenome]|uniref:Uncharacterized protein n=1 Tax=marine sediment metagenome TaxID=412755 RepID=A0A0F9JUY1_9ZZZZ
MNYPIDNMARVAQVIERKEKLRLVCASLEKFKLLKADIWYGIGDNSIGMQKVNDWLSVVK